MNPHPKQCLFICGSSTACSCTLQSQQTALPCATFSFSFLFCQIQTVVWISIKKWQTNWALVTSFFSAVTAVAANVNNLLLLVFPPKNTFAAATNIGSITSCVPEDLFLRKDQPDTAKVKISCIGITESLLGEFAQKNWYENITGCDFKVSCPSPF